MSSLSYTRDHNAWVQRVNKELCSSVKFFKETLSGSFNSEITQNEPYLKTDYLTGQPQYYDPTPYRTFYVASQESIPYEEVRQKHSSDMRMKVDRARPATHQINRLPSLGRPQSRQKTNVSSLNEFEKLESKKKSVTALSMKSTPKSFESSFSISSCSTYKRRQVEELEELLNMERERRIKLENELKAYRTFNK